MIRSEFWMENSGREGKEGNQLEADSESKALLYLPSGLQEPLPTCLLQHLPQSIRTTCFHICLPIHSLRAGSESQLSLHPRTWCTGVLGRHWYQVNEGTK